MPLIDAPTFPIRPHNRAALDHIRYRLGAYPDILDAMLRQLNASSELARWTHRAPDDPGIALLESAAIVADILTFYQEHYANEAFLRTARWHESVQELVRLTGYRLAPGIGGRAAFALEVKGSAPVVVPADFPIKAELETSADPVDFLTSAEHSALPQFSRFHLYRERHVSAGLALHTTTFEIATIGGSPDPGVIGAFDLKKGDKLMLVASAPAWLTSGTSVTAQQASQVVKVSKVTHRLGRLIVEIEGHIEESWSGTVTAYRVNRTFRHFGHNTPPKTTYQSGSGSSMLTYQNDAHVQRHLTYDCQGSPSYLYTELPMNIVPLDQEVNDLSLGNIVLIEAAITPGGSSTLPQRVTVAHAIRGVRAVTMSWGNVSGPSTWIDLGTGAEFVPNGSFYGSTADIREFRIHETTSPVLSLRNPVYFSSGELATADELFFHGAASDAELLIGRRVFLQSTVDDRSADVTVVSIDTAAPEYARMRQVTLDKIPADFTRADFDEAEPAADAFGNIVDVTQGKPEREVALGNGDARQTFQTFKLPKTPLTYLLEPSATPSHVPELTIHIDGREWTRTDSFFASGAKDEVYIVREDAKGESYVQFGDGEMGARLPSGINNVVARYRTGISALGSGKPGAKPTAGARLDHLEKLALAGEVTGGAAPEAAEKARRAAPGKLQSLGRLVSLRDYETETLSIGGVVTASASWEILDGVPAIQLCVLLEQAQQSDLQFAAIEAIVRAADAARGPNRHPIRVTQCELRYVYLSVTYAHDPKLLLADVDAALHAALGLAGDEGQEYTGLFGLRRRRLGEKEYATRIEGTLQNVPGIIWCRVEQFGLLLAADDPTTLALPSAPTKSLQLACTATELLQLHPLHLTLTPSSA